MASLKKSNKARLSGPPEPREAKRPADLTRTLTPSNVVQLGPRSPESPSSSRSVRASTELSRNSRPPSLSLPRASTPTSSATPGSTHALLPLASVPPSWNAESTSSNSPISSSSTPAVTALLTHLNTPERNSSRASSTGNSSTPSRPPALGPVAQRHSAGSQTSSHQSSPSVHSKVSSEDGMAAATSTTSRAGGNSSPTLLRRKRMTATTDIVDASLPPRGQRGMSASSSASDSLEGAGNSVQPSFETHPQATSGEYRESNVAGQLYAHSGSDDAVQLLKNLSNKESASNSTVGHLESNTDASVPEEARRVLAQASAHTEVVEPRQLAGSHSDLAAHPEKALVLHREEEASRDENEDFRAQSERTQPAAGGQEAAIDKTTQGIHEATDTAETSRQGDHDGKNQGANQTPAHETRAAVTGDSDASSIGQTRQYERAKDRSRQEIIDHDAERATDSASAKSREQSPKENHKNPKALGPPSTSFSFPKGQAITDSGPVKSRSLTKIERQIKEDSARVSSVTGPGRPGYEIPVRQKKQTGPRLPINISVDLHLTLPTTSRSSSGSHVKSLRAPRSARSSRSFDYSVICTELDVHKSGLVGRILTFSITALVWCLYQAGLW